MNKNQVLDAYISDARFQVAGIRRYVYKMGPTPLGFVDYFIQPHLRDSWGGPFNGQSIRQQVCRELFQIFRPDLVIETGTFRGTTTEFFANLFPGRIYTVENDAYQHGYCTARFLFRRKIRVFKKDSRKFLARKLGEEALIRKNIFFYLDAHGGKNLPLYDEIKLIFEACASTLVMVDDFQVPGDPGYAYDDYGPKGALTLDYIEDLISGYDLKTFFPAQPSNAETGERRGMILLVSGSQLADKVRSVSLLREYIRG